MRKPAEKDIPLLILRAELREKCKNLLQDESVQTPEWIAVAKAAVEGKTFWAKAAQHAAANQFIERINQMLNIDSLGEFADYIDLQETPKKTYDLSE